MEHSAIRSTFIKLPFVIKLFVFLFLVAVFFTGFTVLDAVSYRIYEQIIDVDKV